MRADYAARVLDEQIGKVPAGRLIESDAKLKAWAEEIRTWLGQSSVELDRVLSPRQLSRDFASMPELGRRPGEPLHVRVDRVQALLASRLATLRSFRNGVHEYRFRLRAWLRSLSGRSITEQIIAALVVAGIVAILGILLATNGSRPPASPFASVLPSTGATSSPVTLSAGPVPVATARPTASTQSPSPSEVGAANYTTDFSDWSGTSDWTVIEGHAFSAGPPSYEHGLKALFAPLATLPSGDVDITARIRVIRYNESLGPYESFGIVARASESGSDALGICHNCSNGSIIALAVAGFEEPLAEHLFDPATEWHDYTLRIRGAHLIGLVGGRPVLDVIETENVGASGVGLWASGTAIDVASFTVTPAN